MDNQTYGAQQYFYKKLSELGEGEQLVTVHIYSDGFYVLHDTCNILDIEWLENEVKINKEAGLEMEIALNNCRVEYNQEGVAFYRKGIDIYLDFI